MTLPSGVIGVLGVALVIAMLRDAFETVLVPRRIGRRIRLTRYFYMLTWRVWRAVAGVMRKPSRREALLGVYGLRARNWTACARTSRKGASTCRHVGPWDRSQNAHSDSAAPGEEHF